MSSIGRACASCLGASTPSMPSRWHSILRTCFKTRPTEEVLFESPKQWCVQSRMCFYPRFENVLQCCAASHEYQSCGVSADGRLLIGLATEQHGLAGVVLRELGIHADRLRASFGEPESSTEHNATVDEPDDFGASVSFVRQLTNAAECARTFGHDFIGTEHLALSLLAETNDDAARLIERLGVDPNSLRDVLAERTRNLMRGCRG